MPPDIARLAYRLDFWGAIFDIAGLTILLSYDLPTLREVLMMIPKLRRRHELVDRIARKADELLRSSPGVNFRHELMVLNEGDADALATLFDDYDQSRAAGVLVAYAAIGNPYLNLPWVGPGVRAATPVHEGPFGPDPIQPLSTPLQVQDLRKQEERRIQARAYTMGFVLMVLGSILSIAQMALGHA